MKKQKNIMGKAVARILFVGLLCSAMACSSDDSDSQGDDSGPWIADPVAQSCSVLQGETDKCSICLGKNCCSETSACLNSSQCRSLTSCMADCTTDACDSNCMNRYKDGVVPLADFAVCFDDNCDSECS